MFNPNSKTYKEDLKKEADQWDKTAKSELLNFPPDYKYYRNTLPYVIYRNVYVKKMLCQIKSKDRVLELGCYNGWFTLEMARKGAVVDAYDISSQAIDVAKNYYKKRKMIEEFSGKIKYCITDLNYPKFPKNTYDFVVIRNVLHHLINLDKLFFEINKLLKPNGKILVDDALPCRKKEAFFSGIFLTLLPTDIPYSKKIQRIFKKGNILERTQGLVDAKGASPFESISSGDESIKYLKKYFNITYFSTFSAIVGTISGHLQLPNLIKEKFLMIFNNLDKFSIKVRLLRGTSFFLIANH